MRCRRCCAVAVQLRTLVILLCTCKAANILGKCPFELSSPLFGCRTLWPCAAQESISLQIAHLDVFVNRSKWRERILQRCQETRLIPVSCAWFTVLGFDAVQRRNRSSLCVACIRRWHPL